MPDDPLARLRLLGLVEGATLLTLLIAKPLKRIVGWLDGVSVMGPVHGLAFLLYVHALAEAAAAGGWRGRDVACAALPASSPAAPS